MARSCITLMLAVLVLFPGTALPSAAQRVDLTTIKKWGYQLQDTDLTQIAASPFELMVIDPSRDDSRAANFEPKALKKIKTLPNGKRRRVVAYLSIGEAEDYRDYWQAAWKQTPPIWLGKENPQWPGNYPVQYWHDDWQSIIQDQLDHIIDADFDGVYLDRIDVFWAYRDQVNSERQMVGFVKKLADHARSKNPAFIVIAQNAEGLLRYDDYARRLDGQAKEDLFFGVKADGVANSAEAIYWSQKHLRAGQAKGLPIFVVEYLSKGVKRAKAERDIRALGFIPAFAERDLRKLSE